MQSCFLIANVKWINSKEYESTLKSNLAIVPKHLIADIYAGPDLYRVGTFGTFDVFAAFSCQA